LQPQKQLARSGGRRVANILYLTLTLAVIVGGVLHLRPAQSREEAELAAEFDANVAPACVDFEAQLQEAAATMDAQMSEGFAGIAEEFAEICVNSDGFIERSKGEEAAARTLSDAMRASVTDLVARCLDDLEARSKDAQALLELRLLLESSKDSPFEPLLEKHSQQVRSYIPQPPTSEIRGGGLGKTFDEGVTWIPILGDAWDVTKLIFGDPRENGIRDRAKKFVNTEKSTWLAIVTEFKNTIPDVATTEQKCRAAFQPGAAIARLTAQ
ncbi:MAG TPA: hypothetical protein PLB55_14755, partial [Prosthecobacter sp.]|nr:hypothetical protein [Prosthecobacter sp.]